jgi:DNA-directed RNA polymerase subunit alpha
MLTLPKPPKVVKKEENRAVIEISELFPGYGSTIGNALRRALYSSLPGAAITSFKMQGVAHEFSTVEGILEDMVEISLNLKQINLKLHGDEPQALRLRVKGVKAATAEDIETPSQVEIINKDAHIATLTSSKASLDMELYVESGMGYVQAEQHSKEKKEIGKINLDAVFSPVRKVNFEVENMRVGDRTDYNRLLMDITTDGTISAEKAFNDAANTLVEHFRLAAQLPTEEDGGGLSTKRSSKKSAVNKKGNSPKALDRKTPATKTRASKKK